jgi:hypothetical protein
MSMVVCPLCGKSTSLRRFPSGFEVDIVVRTVRGLGRGRGFETVNEESVLGDDEVTPLIVNRVLDILSVLLRKGCISGEILSSLHINAEEPEMYVIYDKIREMVDWIEDALGEGWIWNVDKGEEPVEALVERLTDLISAYTESDQDSET